MPLGYCTHSDAGAVALGTRTPMPAAAPATDTSVTIPSCQKHGALKHEHETVEKNNRVRVAPGCTRMRLTAAALATHTSAMLTCQTTSERSNIGIETMQWRHQDAHAGRRARHRHLRRDARTSGLMRMLISAHADFSWLHLI